MRGLECLRLVHRARHDAAALRTLLAQDARQAPGVDVGNRHDVLALEVIGQRLAGAEVGMQARHVAHHQAGGVDAVRLDVLGIDAGVADVGIGQRHDLTRIRGISEDFLITGQRGVEYHLTGCDAVGADGQAAKHRTVS